MTHLIGDAWYLARTDVWRMLHRREILMWTFVMPVIFFYFIGLAIGAARRMRRICWR
jgi:hypothetical protein